MTCLITAELIRDDQGNHSLVVTDHETEHAETIEIPPHYVKMLPVMLTQLRKPQR